MGQSRKALDSLGVDHGDCHCLPVDEVMQLGEVENASVVVGHDVRLLNHVGQQAGRLAEIEAQDVVVGRFGVEIDQIDQLAYVVRAESARRFGVRLVHLVRHPLLGVVGQALVHVIAHQIGDGLLGVDLHVFRSHFFDLGADVTRAIDVGQAEHIEVIQLRLHFVEGRGHGIERIALFRYPAIGVLVFGDESGVGVLARMETRGDGFTDLVEDGESQAFVFTHLDHACRDQIADSEDAA